MKSLLKVLLLIGSVVIVTARPIHIGLNRDLEDDGSDMNDPFGGWSQFGDFNDTMQLSGTEAMKFIRSIIGSSM